MFGLFGSKNDTNAPKIQCPRFTAFLEKKTKVGFMKFKVYVRGYFMPKNGTPVFMVTEVIYDGFPSMNLSTTRPQEIKLLSDYAVETFWPRIIGQSK